ncbi:HlyD family type I secretion membrane fusion protein [Rhodobacter aestuarii]|uniref:Membrane fusion protein (MFP) family protein n=1 Tax=Rhodobacter aestuarii TaxID=453582 RepID=A0A1N7IY87_9RHOB|nr:HlyD family type I secretion periplasmic adaptor subunit [Rhodobacter aestuarii]PTV97408.1 HlyD family type I secretion membrane fusion protein [Rhodobacter aestuarii]SIS41961.1 type I secretion membrane fusion protein, HlyD family [Rhodobacter aestuarii]
MSYSDQTALAVSASAGGLQPAGGVSLGAAKSGRRRKRNIQLRHLAESIRLEERTDGIGLQAAIWLCAAMLVAITLWAGRAELPIVVQAPGQIMPASFERELVHREAGRLVELAVRPGEKVAQGQLIARLDDDDLVADLQLQARQRLSFLLRIERLTAFVEARDPDFRTGDPSAPFAAEELVSARNAWAAMKTALHDQTTIVSEQLAKAVREQGIVTSRIAAQKDLLASMEDLLGRKEVLFAKELVAYPVIIEARQAVISAKAELEVLERQFERSVNSIRELDARLLAVTSERQASARQDLEVARAGLAETDVRIATLSSAIEMRRIRAPIDGTVKLPERLAVGDYIGAGRPIGHIVPTTDRLVARVRIPAEDIANIAPGMSVELKITALDYTRFGTISGILETLSPAAMLAENGAVYFTAEVSPNVEYIDYQGRELKLIPGMTVEAGLINGSRTILEYLFNPINQAVYGAFHEG